MTTENLTTTDPAPLATPEADPHPPVLPAGVDPLDELSVAELDIASRQLKADVYEAVGGKDGKRWHALALLAWLWSKRRDPHAKLQPFLDMTGAQLTHVLRLDEQPAQQPVDQVDDVEAVAANPTAPGAGS